MKGDLIFCIFLYCAAIHPKHNFQSVSFLTSSPANQLCSHDANHSTLMHQNCFLAGSVCPRKAERTHLTVALASTHQRMTRTVAMCRTSDPAGTGKSYNRRPFGSTSSTSIRSTSAACGAARPSEIFSRFHLREYTYSPHHHVEPSDAHGFCCHASTPALFGFSTQERG